METNQNQNMNNETQNSVEPKKKSLFLKWVVALGIVIVLNLFFGYTIQLIYDSPDYEDFCGERTTTPLTESACVENGGKWSSYEGNSQKPIPEGERDGWCDADYSCRMDYQDARDLYNRNVFIVLVILGILSIIASFFVMQAEAVSLGLSLGGVLSLVIGTIRYWSDMDDILRVIVLAIALGVLIWLGIKKIKD